MLFWVIQISLLSIIFIFLVHHLLVFFKSTLTTPKIKDLVNSPNQKYQNIFDTLIHQNEPKNYTDIDLLPSDTLKADTQPSSMKDELKTFLKRQLNSDDIKNNNNRDDFMGIDSGTINFSNF